MKPLVCFSLLLVILLTACGTVPTSIPTSTKVLLTETLPKKTPTPRLTDTPRPVSLYACVTNSTIRIRSGPGKQYEVIGGMVSGTCMSVLGRNTESDWVYMISDDNKSGWVAASLLTIEGDITRVSVRSLSEVLSVAPPTKALPTQQLRPTATDQPFVFFTNTPRPVISQPTAKRMNCSPAYPTVCIPPKPPDLDCGDIPYRRFTVLSPDPHGFDGDGDGIGCESG